MLDPAGATRPRRDAVDARLVRNARKGTGHLINSPTQVGGWSDLTLGTTSPLPDTDRDGMPDLTERTRGLDPGDPEDRNAVPADDGLNQP